MADISGGLHWISRSCVVGCEERGEGTRVTARLAVTASIGPALFSFISIFKVPVWVIAASWRPHRLNQGGKLGMLQVSSTNQHPSTRGSAPQHFQEVCEVPPDAWDQLGETTDHIV